MKVRILNFQKVDKNRSGLYFSVKGDYEIGQNASLTCNARHEQLAVIIWFYDFGGSADQHVSTWTDGRGPPSDHGQWLGRTELNTDTGDIVIHHLMIKDEGTYTCRYDNNSVSLPGKSGDAHTVRGVRCKINKIIKYNNF